MVTYGEACLYFPGGVNSPVRACKSVGITPPIVSRAYKDSFVDSSGKHYIDFCGSWGSLIHGHSHPEIEAALTEALPLGCSYGLTSEVEVRFAKLLLDSLGLPHHRIRFVSSGTEAAMTAVRLAKGVTQRRLCIKFVGCYHGHADSLMQGESPSKNPSRELLEVPYNDLDTFQETMFLLGDSVAGVIFEPVCANMGVVLPEPQFLEKVITLCRKYSALSIMDEVVTGFRLSLGGAGEAFELFPDIVIYGKILGGGLPVAAVVAHKNIMNYLAPDGPVFQAGTLSGNPLAMVAGLTSISMCRRDGFYQKLAQLENIFFSPLKEAIVKKGFPISLVHSRSMFSLFFSPNAPKQLTTVQQTEIQAFRTFYQKIFSRGLYLSPSPFEASFLSSAHTHANLEYAVDIILKALDETLVQPEVFRYCR